MSLRDAINAKCKDCIYDRLARAGHWREQVAQCSSYRCPLWPVRPAPESGSFANPPRDHRAVRAGWLLEPMGMAVSPRSVDSSAISGAHEDQP